MGNKMLRLAIVYNEKKEVLGFVALRENGTQEYGFGKTFDEIKKCYNQLMKELIATYPDGLKDLIASKDTKGIRKYLTEKDYIVEANNDIITKLVVSYNGSEFGIEVNYAIKDKELFLFHDGEKYNAMYNKYLQLIEKSYKIINANNYKGLVDIKTIKKEEDYDSLDDAYDDYDDDYSDEYYDDLDREEKTKKTKNIKVKKKFIALVAAGTALALTTVGVVGYKLGKKDNNKATANFVSEVVTHEIELPTNVPTIEPTSTPTIEPTPTPTVRPTPLPTATSTPAPIYSLRMMTSYEKSLEPEPYVFHQLNPDNSPELWAVVYPDGGEDAVNIGEVDISTIDIQEKYNEIYQNLYDLSNYAFHGDSILEQNHQLNSLPKRVHFERIIPGLNKIEVKYVKYFSDLINELIYLGFCENDIPEALSTNYRIVQELVRCIDYNHPLRLQVDGREMFVCYTDLGYEAQEVVKNICWGSYILMGPENVEFDGQVYNQEDIGYKIFNQVKEASPNF